jgi:hypothetical protein
MRTDQRGSTLLVVVWLLAIMGIIATFLIYRSETEWAALVNAEKSATGRELAEQVLYEHIALLLQDDQENDNPEAEWFGKTGRFVSERDGYEITVIVEDEGSKPNLNLMIESALRCFGIPDDQAVAPLLDWLDPDQKELDDGAEAPYYRSLDPAYKPRDGFCSSLQELLLVKDGPALYPYLAPELTTYGKLNFNILTPDQFKLIAASAGFDKFTVDSLVGNFEAFKGVGQQVTTTTTTTTTATTDEKRVTSFELMQKHPKLSFFTPDKCQKLKPFLQFKGSWNINFMSYQGLKAAFMLATMGQLSKDKVASIAKLMIEYRNKTKPFESLEEITTQLKVLCSMRTLSFAIEDYFTMTSSLIRYQVWAVKGDRKYYLNTVQERVAGDLRTKWKVRTLAWQALTNKMAPEIPEFTPFEEALNLETEATSTETPAVSSTPGESSASVETSRPTGSSTSVERRRPVGLNMAIESSRPVGSSTPVESSNPVQSAGVTDTISPAVSQTPVVTASQLRNKNGAPVKKAIMSGGKR